MGDFLFGLLIVGGIFGFLYWVEWNEYKSTGRETDIFHIGRKKDTEVSEKTVESKTEYVNPQQKPKPVEPKPEKPQAKKETSSERKYRAVWSKIARATDDRTILFENELGGKLEYLESFFRGVYRIDDKKNVCHSGGYINPEFPYFILGFAVARKIYPDKVRTKLSHSNDLSNRQLLLLYAKTIVKLLTHEVRETSIKSKIGVTEVEKIINSYRCIPSESDAFELTGGYAQNIPNEFRGFIMGYYAGTYRIKKEDLANMCWSWEFTKKMMTSESKNYSYLADNISAWYN